MLIRTENGWKPIITMEMGHFGLGEILPMSGTTTPQDLKKNEAVWLKNALRSLCEKAHPIADICPATGKAWRSE